MNIFDDTAKQEPRNVHESTFVHVDRPNWPRALDNAEDFNLIAHGLCTARTTFSFLQADTPHLTRYCDELAKYAFAVSQEHQGEQRNFFLHVSATLQMKRTVDKGMQDDRALQVVALATLQCAFAHIFCLTRCGDLNGLVEIVRLLQQEVLAYVDKLSWQLFEEQVDIGQDKLAIDEHAQVVLSNLREVRTFFESTSTTAPIMCEGDMQRFFQYSLDRLFNRLGGAVHDADCKSNPFPWMDDCFGIGPDRDVSLLEYEGDYDEWL